MIMEGSLQSTQEQLSGRVTEVVRYEQLTRRLQAELHSLQDRCGAVEEEAAEQTTLSERYNSCLVPRG